MWHFIWVSTVCKTTHLGVSVYKGLNDILHDYIEDVFFNILKNNGLPVQRSSMSKKTWEELIRNDQVKLCMDSMYPQKCSELDRPPPSKENYNTPRYYTDLDITLSCGSQNFFIMHFYERIIGIIYDHFNFTKYYRKMTIKWFVIIPL